MVDHNHNWIKIIDGEKVGDKIHWKVLEVAGSFEGEGSNDGDSRIDEHLMCLAHHTTKNIFLDIGGETQPPIVLGEEGNCLQVIPMAPLKGAMGGRDQIMASNFQHIEMDFIIEMAVIKSPILDFESVEEGKFLLYLVDCLKD